MEPSGQEPSPQEPSPQEPSGSGAQMDDDTKDWRHPSRVLALLLAVVLALALATVVAAALTG